jgi:hypothetical protein
MPERILALEATVLGYDMATFLQGGLTRMNGDIIEM